MTTELFDKARGIKEEKSKKKKRENKGKERLKKIKNEDGVYQPPHLAELEAKPDTSHLVEYEPDYIDRRLESGEAYTETGRLLYMNPNDVPVGVWDPSQIEPDAAMALFGRRRTGKSYLTRDILYCFQDYFDRGLVFTGTKDNYFFQRVPKDKLPEDLEGKNNGFIPERAVIQNYDPEVLGNFLDLQMAIRTNAEEYRKKLNYELPAFVWLDDVISENTIQRDGMSGHLLSLFSKGRHYKVMCGINTQYPKAIPARMRDNLDYAIIFKLDSKMEKAAILEHFMGELNPRTSEEMIRKYTHGQEDGVKQCLVINMKTGVPFEEKYKTYSAYPKDLPPFMVGSKTFEKEFGYRDEKPTILNLF